MTQRRLPLMHRRSKTPVATSPDRRRIPADARHAGHVQRTDACVERARCRAELHGARRCGRAAGHGAGISGGTVAGNARAGDPSPRPPIDLDDLARRVYGQVRTQLRSELLIDRERAGLLTDFR